MLRVGFLQFESITAFLKQLFNPSCNATTLRNNNILRDKLNQIIGWLESYYSFKYDPDLLLEFIKEDLGYKDIFSKSVGVKEGFTLEEHTITVMDNFEDFNLKDMLPACELNLLPLIRFSLGVHDIGKPEAVENGDKNLQHKYTKVIIDREMARLGFLESEKKFVQALVSGDPIGKLIKGQITLDDSYNQIIEMSKNANMDVRTFFQALLPYYISDAYAYPTVKALFENKDGTLVIKRDKGHAFYELKKKIMKESVL